MTIFGQYLALNYRFPLKTMIKIGFSTFKALFDLCSSQYEQSK